MADPTGDVESLARAEASTTVEVSVSGGRAHAVVSPFRLRIVEGPGAGASYVAKSERIVIGTHDSAEVILRDRTVSRFHCELAVECGRVVVRDLDSRNGTLVDGVSIREAYLASSSMLTLGTTKIAFDLGPTPIHIPISSGDRFGSLVGRSVAMRAVFSLLERAATSEATVLLEGETGTGKEAAAESIHAASARGAGPLVVIDCGAIPPQLLETELFGHEKGAFTGAVASRAGAFETARGGTVFLDEIGELPIELQPKLLRVLEKREAKRIGSARYEPVDVRIIAAANRKLTAEVNAQRFRDDLYYRLAVITVRLPALRERTEDLTILVEHLLATAGAAHLPEAELLRTDACRRAMVGHPWPGNVRELRNYVERCLALREPMPLVRDDEPRVSALDLRAARETSTREFERAYLETLLARHNNNVSAAARAAGIDRKHLYRLLWRHGLR